MSPFRQSRNFLFYQPNRFSGDPNNWPHDVLEDDIGDFSGLSDVQEDIVFNEHYLLKEAFNKAGTNIKYGEHKTLVRNLSFIEETIGTDELLALLHRHFKPGILCMCTTLGYTNCIPILVKCGLDPNRPYRNKYPLIIAASKGDLKMVRILLAAGARLDVTPSSANVVRSHIKNHMQQLGLVTADENPQMRQTLAPPLNSAPPNEHRPLIDAVAIPIPDTSVTLSTSNLNILSQIGINIVTVMVFMAAVLLICQNTQSCSNFAGLFQLSSQSNRLEP